MPDELKQIGDAIVAAVKAYCADFLKNVNGSLSALDEKIKTIQLTPGPQGERGEKGIDGVNGENGKDGIAGERGIDGVAGERGADGAVGANGADGINGKDGADGANGKDGIAGERGADGINGKDGADGAIGINGKDGATGERGATGEKGALGEKGADGAAGVNGADGKDGAQGADGAVGANGADGINGKDGANGVDGKDGAVGADGINGKEGERGADGINGKDGADGASGKDGAAGERGTDGVNGERGVDGVNGKDGISAYRSAVEMGYVGTELQWLNSLHGKDGEHGRDGRDGREGKDGLNGRDAFSIEILPAIDKTKEYPRGTFALFRGGMIHAARNTDPVGDKPVAEYGWAVCLNGISNELEEILEEGRIIKRTTYYTDGTDSIRLHKTAIELYRGVWAEGEYEMGDTATRGGSVWHCQYPTHDVPGSGSKAWKLMVKEGARGKDGIVHTDKPTPPVRI